MRLNVRTFFLLATSFFAFCNGSAEMLAQGGLSAAKPKWTVQLRNYGWKAPEFESNKKFFKDFAISKLAAMDPDTRILFASNDLLIIYHTKQEGQDYRTATRQVEAFFLNALDGSLLRTKVWPVSMRKSENELRDSEGRMLALQDGRFLVHTNDNIMIYDRGLNLITQHKLEPLNSTDMWGVQGVAGGTQIFLRHESGPQVTYEWLASDSLQLLRKTSGFRNRNHLPQASVRAGESAVFTGSSSGLEAITPDQQVKIICEDQLCRGPGELHVLASSYIVFSGRTGIEVIDQERGLVWAKTIAPTANPNDFQFGGITSSISGTRFGLWMTSYRKTLFDGVTVHQSPVLLIYDATNPMLLWAIPIKQQAADFDVALSPDEKQLAIFDGASLRLHMID